MMLRRFVAVLSLLLLANNGWAQEKNPTLPIIVSWHGQSFFLVKSTRGLTIAFDPHLIPAYGRPEGLRADVVLISHLHDDHTQVQALENAKDKSLKVISGLVGKGARLDWNAVDETIKDVRIYSVGAYHDSAQGMMRGKNAIFVVEMDGWRICHLGDVGHSLSAEQLKKIGAVDVLMVPVGGVYALNGTEAKKVVEQIHPKEYIFPMHYGTKAFDDLLPIDEFLDGQEKAKVTSSPDNRLILNRDPNRPRPLIVQLNFWPRTKRD